MLLLSLPRAHRSRTAALAPCPAASGCQAMSAGAHTAATRGPANHWAKSPGPCHIGNELRVQKNDSTTKTPDTPAEHVDPSRAVCAQRLEGGLHILTCRGLHSSSLGPHPRGRVISWDPTWSFPSPPQGPCRGRGLSQGPDTLPFGAFLGLAGGHGGLTYVEELLGGSDGDPAQRLLVLLVHHLVAVHTFGFVQPEADEV